ncbi:ATP-binding protein [Streptomyces sp. NPDC060031]|uniref:ATP-binding protein n=1 Tax=Streptomyces sp. NPDC060031 TaxID=3347043 RepID=UPI0036B2DFE4
MGGPVLARELAHSAATVLVTARRPLRVSGEQLLALAPLDVPPPGAGAAWDPAELEQVASVALLVARAAEVRSGFALTEENAPALAGLCTLLEGLPLALVLAAERLRLFTPQVLLARLAQGGSALTGLAGGPADAPARHRALGALAASQLAGLEPAERHLLERLAPFAPGFGMRMAGRVRPAGHAPFEPVLDTLLDAHLVTGADGGPEPRLTVPEPVRSHLLEQLGQDRRLEDVRDRHAEAYQQLVLAAEPRLTGPEEVRWLRILDAEHANVAGALDRLEARGDRESAASVLLALWTPWLAYGHLAEGLRRCERLLAEQPGRPAPAESVQARLIDLSASFTLAPGDADLAVRRHRRALALCKRLGDRRQSALVTARLGIALLHLPDAEAAEAALRPALTALESLGAAAPAAEAATALARALRLGGGAGLRRAAELREQALDTHRRIRGACGLAHALTEAAAAALDPGAGEEPDDLGALRALREVLELYAGLGERTRLPAALETYALVMLRASPRTGPRRTRPRSPGTTPPRTGSS